ERLGLDERTDWSYRAVMLVDSAFVFDPQQSATWPRCLELAPHAIAAVNNLGDTARLGADPIETGQAGPSRAALAAGVRLLNRVGHFLLDQARYLEAQAALERALTLGYQVYGQTNPRLAAVANNLGRVLQRTGDLTQA